MHLKKLMVETILSNIETALNLLKQIEIYLNNRASIISRKNQNALLRLESSGREKSFSIQVKQIIENNIVIPLRNHLIEKQLHRSMGHYSQQPAFNQWEALISKDLSLQSFSLERTLAASASMFDSLKKRKVEIGEDKQVIVSNGKIEQFGWNWFRSTTRDSLECTINTRRLLEQVKVKILELRIT